LSRWAASSALFLLTTLAAAADRAEVRLGVHGQVREEGGQLRVRVDLAHQGGPTLRGMDVEGELLGQRAEATLAQPLGAGRAASVELAFTAEVKRPGVHALALHLQYFADEETPSAVPTSQRAYLLLALGANPPPPVTVTVPDARVARHAVVPVRLRSADGAPHRVRLRALAPRGVHALEPDQPVTVPAGGSVDAPLRVLGAGAPAGSEAGLVVFASEVDGPLERTAVATGRVHIVAARPWLPRLRAPLLLLALGLLAAALAVELWSWRRSA
jgi:hypothetical protein